MRPSAKPSSGLIWPAVGLIAVAVMVSPVAMAEFSLSLMDPVAGRNVTIEPGAEALHIVFFATWCPACLEELETLRDVEARWGDRGYRLVLVAVKTRHSPERLVNFVRDDQPPGEVLLDERGAAEKALSVSMLPEHLLFDRMGREVARSDNLEEFLPAIKKLFAGSRRGTRRGS